MFKIMLLVYFIEMLLLILPSLLSIAYVTILERKTMASMQKRLGPNEVGYYGLLQAFADALKLLLKEYLQPNQSNIILIFIGPIITLIFSLLVFIIIPFSPDITLFHFNLGVLYFLAMSSLSTYGILLAGWSANSKYAFIGSLRSTAQLISYELVITSLLLIIIMLSASLNLSVNIESQRNIWYLIPLLPVCILFIISSLAETNRAPFDLTEAESELVSGFMTEHAASIFVFFFLAEYGNLTLMGIFISIFFIGGYIPFNLLLDNNNIICNLIYGLILGIKCNISVILFILIRASFPRLRFDKLMSLCWTKILPFVVSLIILIPCIICSFNIMIIN